jgi:hypothetical protein
MMLNLALFPIVGYDFGHEYSSIVNGTLKMTETSYIRMGVGRYCRSLHFRNGSTEIIVLIHFVVNNFYGDCAVEDLKTREDLLRKWLHSAFLTGYNTGRCSKNDEPN